MGQNGGSAMRLHPAASSDTTVWVVLPLVLAEVRVRTDTDRDKVGRLHGPVLCQYDCIVHHWCIITTPKRRHLVKNFATRISEKIATHLNIPFYEDVCSCRTKQRVNAIFDVNIVPDEQNIICFDDFVTTGQTLQAMARALEPFKKNLLFLCGINNKL